MGQKDTTEKLLMDYNDVFADIVNGLLCKGEQVVQPCDLVMSQPISQYKVDGKIHEMERDVCKYWKPGNVRIALYHKIGKILPFLLGGEMNAAITIHRQMENGKQLRFFLFPFVDTCAIIKTEHMFYTD